MAKEMLERVSADELLRQKYYAREKAIHDEMSRIGYAEMKGMEKGIEKTAEAAFRKGADLDFVAEITGLPISRLKEIEAKIKEEEN